MRSHFKQSALSVAAAQALVLCAGSAMAQTSAPAAAAPASAASGAASGKGEAAQTVVVTGQRAALQSAQAIKRNSEDIVDGVVAEEAGKLPDKSITEVLQRVVGVTMDRNRSRGDPEHFSVEGSGIQVRGLSWGSSTLNGRESFSAGWPGRELSWGDVPAELMSAVLVHKNPPAELIEGGISGQVDLRTALPFDYAGRKTLVSVSDNYNALGNKHSPAISGLYSTRWSNDLGEWGALLDLSVNRSNTHNDTIQVDAYYPRTDLVGGQTVWVPRSASWRTNTSQTDRAGLYAALQWKKGDKQSTLTIFDSVYRDMNLEHALFTGVENSYKSQIANPVYDSRGVLVSGTYTYPTGGLGANNFQAGGLGFNVDTGYSTSHSQTRDISWNFKWDAGERWAFQNDLQWVHATDHSQNSVVALATFVPDLTLDTRGGVPRISFDQAAIDFLGNPGNYYLGNVMPMLNKGSGDLAAWKADAQYKIDGGLLRDVRFGLRLTQRSSTNVNGSGTGWYSLAQPWFVKQTSVPGHLPGPNDGQSWQNRGSFGYLSDPRYAALVPTQTIAFNNFFNGKAGTAPNLVAPSLNLAKGYPGTYAALPQILQLECQDGNALFGSTNDCSTAGSDWKPLTYDGDPANTSKNKEQTQAVYGTLRFADDELKFPTEGNLGLRVVHTRSTADGYTVFTPGTNPPPDVPAFGPINAPHKVTNSYFDFLPSLNVKTDLTSKLQARLALSQGMYRPGFDSLQAYETLAQNVTTTGSAVTGITYTGTARGNPKLKPIRSNNYDASLEWYPRNGASLTGDVFYKQLKDIILQSAHVESYPDLAGNSQDFLISAPDNVAKGSVGGFELGGLTYFDHLPVLEDVLPGWLKGFGISANYTYIHSSQKLYHPFNLPYCPSSNAFNNGNLSLYGCDTNGLPFNSLPIQYLSKNAFNVAFLYDAGPLSARLAYSWRSRFLQGVNVNGTEGSDGTSADPARNGAQDVGWGLPTWQEATGQWDGGVDYKFSDKFMLSLSATNLTDIVIRQTQQQHVGNMGRAWFEPGRSYRLSARYEF